MNWLNVVWLTATAVSVAVMVLSNMLLGFGWYALGTGAPAFVIVSVTIPLVLGMIERRGPVPKRRGRRAR